MTDQPQQDVCCLMGMPVAGNPTQYMLEKAFEAARVDWRFLTFEVSPRDFEGALRGARIFGFRGILLAPPHRATVLPYLEEMSKSAQLSGQVNCIAQVGGRLHGTNTEGVAFRQLLKPVMPIVDARVTIVGAGRLARSIASELALAGAGELTFACRQPETVGKLAAQLLEQTPLSACQIESLDGPFVVSEDCQLLVNATPIGRHNPDERLPVQLSRLSSSAVVADVVYNPPGTWLMREVAQRDCRTIDGLTLYIERTALAFETWTAADADRAVMREAVEEFLVL
ncbi:MAG: shikimate dehydrogenase [Pirellulales bacterium]